MATSKSNILPGDATQADKACRDAKAADKRYTLKDSDVSGLFLRIATSGTKKWFFRYSVKVGDKWKDREVTLGDLRRTKNSTSGLTTAQARKEADRLKSEIRHHGADPIADRQKQADQRAAEEAARFTVNDLFEQWMRVDIRTRKDGGAEVRRTFAKDVLPKLGRMDVKDVRKGHIADITDTILARNCNRLAKVVFSDMRQMFTFAVTRDMIERNPTADIKKKDIGGKDVERNRVLTDDEIITLFRQLPESGLSIHSQIAMRLAISTCCRIGEIITAQWDNVDIAQRTLILPDTKNGEPHTIYLSDFALAELSRLRATFTHPVWCFPSTRKENSHVCTKSFSKQVADRQRDEAALTGRSKHTTALKLKGGRWTPHDLRRTAATIMVRSGTLPEVAERCLNHKEQNKIQRIYQHYAYEKEQRHAWQVLGEHLAMLDRGESKVVSFSSRTQDSA